jgi:hypothetical protein
MKKAVAAWQVLLLTASIALVPMEAQAERKTQRSARTVLREYTGPNTIHLNNSTANSSPLPTARPRVGETKVLVQVVNTGPDRVRAEVHQGNRKLGAFCDMMDRPVPLVTNKPVHVHLYLGKGCGGMSVPTAGKVLIQFYKD